MLIEASLEAQQSNIKGLFARNPTSLYEYNQTNFPDCYSYPDIAPEGPAQIFEICPQGIKGFSLLRSHALSAYIHVSKMTVDELYTVPKSYTDICHKPPWPPFHLWIMAALLDFDSECALFLQSTRFSQLFWKRLDLIH